jgi:hypothetical protein
MVWPPFLDREAVSHSAERGDWTPGRWTVAGPGWLPAQTHRRREGGAPTGAMSRSPLPSAAPAVMLLHITHGFGGLQQLIPKIRMRNADQRHRPFSRRFAMQIHRTIFGDYVLCLRAWIGYRAT